MSALTTDYVFRGVSQTSEGPAIQGGFDATCGMFYAGVWASSLDWGTGVNGAGDTVNLRTSRWTLRWHQVHDRQDRLGSWRDLLRLSELAAGIGTAPRPRLNYVELKVGASGEIWKGGTLGGTVFYSPDYQYETGAVWTFEGSFSQTLPTIMGRITPTFSALYGYQVADRRQGSTTLSASPATTRTTPTGTLV